MSIIPQFLKGEKKKPERCVRIKKVRWGKLQREDKKQEAKESMKMKLSSYWKNSDWVSPALWPRSVRKMWGQQGQPGAPNRLKAARQACVLTWVSKEAKNLDGSWDGHRIIHYVAAHQVWMRDECTQNRADGLGITEKWAGTRNTGNTELVGYECCTQYVSKSGKLSSGHRTRKGRLPFQSQRRAMPKNVQTTIQLCSFHTLPRLCSKSFKVGFWITWTENFQMYKLSFEEPEEPKIKLPKFVDSWIKQGSFRKTSTSLTTLQLLIVWITTHRGNFWKKWEYHLTDSWETCMWVKKQQLEPDMEQLTGSKLGKEYNKVYTVTLLI